MLVSIVTSPPPAPQEGEDIAKGPQTAYIYKKLFLATGI